MYSRVVVNATELGWELWCRVRAGDDDSARRVWVGEGAVEGRRRQGQSRVSWRGGGEGWRSGGGEAGVQQAALGWLA